jgi:hypothetical protein
MKNITVTTADLPTKNPQSQIENTRSQLDLSFSATAAACERPAWRRRQMLRSRATWWFHQMRRVVDSAVEWPAPTPHPEQTTLDLRRATEVTVNTTR